MVNKQTGVTAITRGRTGGPSLTDLKDGKESRSCPAAKPPSLAAIPAEGKWDLEWTAGEGHNQY